MSETIVPRQTFIDTELDLRLEKNNNVNTQNLTDLMMGVLMTKILLSSQLRGLSREHLQKVLPKILEEAELNYKSTQDRKWLYIQIASGALSIIVGGYCGAGFASEFAKQPFNIAKEVVTKFSYEKSIGDGAGAVLNAIAQHGNTHAEGERGLRSHKIQYWNVIREQDSEASRTLEGNVQSSEQALMQLFLKAHEAAQRMLSSTQ